MHGVKYRSECLRSSCLHIPAVLGICVLTRVRGAFPHQLPTATLHNVGVPSSFSGGKTEARSLRSILWWSCAGEMAQAQALETLLGGRVG